MKGINKSSQGGSAAEQGTVTQGHLSGEQELPCQALCSPPPSPCSFPEGGGCLLIAAEFPLESKATGLTFFHTWLNQLCASSPPDSPIRKYSPFIGHLRPSPERPH